MARAWSVDQQRVVAVPDGAPLPPSFIPLDAADVQRVQNVADDESLLGVAKAVGAGALRGVTLGLSDAALTESTLTTPERIEQLREGWPVLSAVGEIGGMAATAPFSASPVGALSRVAAAAGAGVTAKLTGASIASRVIARGAGAVTRSGIEGLAFGAGSGLADVAMGRSTAGEAADRAVEGMAYGALTALGFLGASGLVSGARKLATFGHTPTRAARGAQQLLDLEAAAGPSTGGMAARVNTMSELMALRETSAGLRTRARAGLLSTAEMEALSNAEQRMTVLQAELRAIDDEIVSAYKTRRTRTTTETEKISSARQSAKSKRAAHDVPDPQATRDETIEKIARGESLAENEIEQALIDDFGRVLEMDDWLNGRIDLARNEARAYFKLQARGGGMTFDPDAQAMRYKAYLWSSRNAVRLQKGQIEKALGQIRTGRFRDEGRAIGAAFGDTVTAPVGGAAAADDVARTITTTERIAERIPVDPAARAAARAATAAPIPRELLETIAQQRGPSEMARFLAWRSAPVVLGWALGGPVGAALGSFAGAQSFRNAVGGIVDRLVGATSPVMGAIRDRLPTVVTGSIVATDPMDWREAKLRTAAPPDAIYAEATEGYRQAGLDHSVVDALAQYQARRYAMLRDAVPQRDGDARANAKYRRTAAALDKPAEILARISDGIATREDWDVLRVVYPEISQRMAAEARSILSSGAAIRPSARRTLMTLATGGTGNTATDATLQRAIATTASEPMPGPDPAAAKFHAGAGATATQGAAMSLGGAR